jgi:hypothetical protein
VKLAGATAVLALALSLPAAAQPALQERQYLVPGHGNLVLNVPTAWRTLDRSLAEPPSVILRMSPAAGDAFYLQITSFRVAPPKLAEITPQYLQQRVQENAKGLLPKAVEPEAKLLELKGNGAVGYYFSLTDKTSRNTPGDYKYVIQGTVLAGEMLTIFTFLHRDPDLQERDWVVRMFADAAYVKGPPAANAPADALQIKQLEKVYELTVPASKLVMTLPQRDFARVTNPAGGAEHKRYFYFVEGPLSVSGWFEPAPDFPGLQAFWEKESGAWKSRGLPEPQNVSFTKVGDWDAIVYDVAVPSGSSSHIRAHWVQSGTWIDLHASLAARGSSAETRAKLAEFLQTIRIREKEREMDK